MPSASSGCATNRSIGLLFLRLVARHRVAPLVWQSLKTTDDSSIPDQVRSDLRRRVKKEHAEGAQADG